jgi:hypothetical protein
MAGLEEPQGSQARTRRTLGFFLRDLRSLRAPPAPSRNSNASNASATSYQTKSTTTAPNGTVPQARTVFKENLAWKLSASLRPPEDNHILL